MKITYKYTGYNNEVFYHDADGKEVHCPASALAQDAIIQPADPIQGPTWQEKRAARYKAEVEPLMSIANGQWRDATIAWEAGGMIGPKPSPDYSAADARRLIIKTEIPKI